MVELLKAFAKQPYWVLTLVIGSVLVAAPCVTVDKDNHWATHQANPLVLVVIGCVILLISVIGFVTTFWTKRTTDADGSDLASVEDNQGVLSTRINGCEIRVIEGRIEQYVHNSETAIVLPCNEYFDDLCARDSRSSLGAYVNRVFGVQSEEFIALMLSEASKKFGNGNKQEKTEGNWSVSFGAGKCLLLNSPLGRPDPVALISTSTQRANEGLRTEISCLFEGMHRLNECLADAKIREVAMPVLGGGHGGVHPPLALVGLLLAIAEAARYGRGAQRLRQVTLIVFKKDDHTPAEVDKIVIRRALALIGVQK
jgi:hypothetical protein